MSALESLFLACALDLDSELSCDGKLEKGQEFTSSAANSDDGISFKLALRGVKSIILSSSLVHSFPIFSEEKYMLIVF